MYHSCFAFISHTLQTDNSLGWKLQNIKKKKIKQADLGKMIGTSGDIIGKYERGENTLDRCGCKNCRCLAVTLDYLVKDAEHEQIDNDTLKRLKEVQGLDAENRSHVFATIDAFIKAAKLKSIAAM